MPAVIWRFLPGKYLFRLDGSASQSEMGGGGGSGSSEDLRCYIATMYRMHSWTSSQVDSEGSLMERGLYGMGCRFSSKESMKESRQAGVKLIAMEH